MNNFSLFPHSDGTTVTFPPVLATPIDRITYYLKSLQLRADSGAISTQTLKTYTQGIKTFVKEVGVNAPVTTETYTDFIKHLSNVSPSSVRTYKAAVLDYYKFCKLEHGIEIDWIALQEATHRYTKKAKKEFITYDETAVDSFVEYALTLTTSLLDLRNRAMIITFVDSGFRNFELRELTVGDIDWESKSVLIRGKGDKPARVRFSDRSLNCIHEYLEERAILDSRFSSNRDVLPLFSRHDKSAGKKILPIGGGGVWAAIKALCREANIDEKKVWVHVLRHKFVTEVLRKTQNLKKAQILARHSNIETTQRYAHIAESELDATYDEIFN